jgi:cation transport regulator
MPYFHNTDLPLRVRAHLPAAAQTVYRKVYNSAWKHYARAQKRRAGTSREETAHRVAWSAVRQSWRKRGDSWVRKS